MSGFDSVLLVGFGAPRDLRHLRPFLRLVVRGRGIPPERLDEVAHHYEQVGGSPYNELAFRQAVALKRRLKEGYRLRLPVYAGMRNWHPFLARVVRCMNHAGRRRAVGIILAAHRSGTSLERYMLDVARGIQMNQGRGPEVLFLGPWFDDPGFLEACAARIEESSPYHRGDWPREVPVLFTAHSIPSRMAASSPYVEDLLASCRGVAELLGVADWELCYQSRSGDPRTPWLEPDVADVLRRRAAEGCREVVVQPIGFLHDHVEVLFDLDLEAREIATGLGMTMHRAGAVGDHPAFIDALARRVARVASGDTSGCLPAVPADRLPPPRFRAEREALSASGATAG